MPPIAPVTVTLLGRQHAVRLPSFAEREELVLAVVDARERPVSVQLRIWSAAIGLATRIGTEAKASYAASRCDVLVFGGEVYSWLREQGATPADIRTAGQEVLTAVSNAMAPREPEVAAAADFSGRSEAPST